MNVVECTKLVKRFGGTAALNGINFELEENKITGLIGRNGAGKTTLLKLMAGYLRPTAGQVRVFGLDPFNSLKVSANLIFVDESMAFPPFSLREILDEASKFYANWDKPLADGLFEYFALNPKQRHANLSKGMKSTFNAIVGIAAHCPLTILDEPTSGMDSAVRRDFYRALLKDYIACPRSVILSSHLLSEVEELLENILLIDGGREYLHLPVSDLKEYAVGLRGSAVAIIGQTNGCEVIHRESYMNDGVFLVVKNDFSHGELERLRQTGVEILPVSADELCVYLTSKSQGGIDDVFNRG
jgi:ABC-2 type transport system ATP-binding protein